jgi:hypothetical protein
MLAGQRAISKKVPLERNRMMPATLLSFAGVPADLARQQQEPPGRE